MCLNSAFWILRPLSEVMEFKLGRHSQLFRLV